MSDGTTGDVILNEIEGDLFTTTQSLCHCVSEDLAMSKGIAVIFKNKFQGVQELKAQRAQRGGMCFLQRDGRFVYYLVTKQKYFHKPTYDTLAGSLTAMRDHMVANGVQNIDMPKIGCGLDGLNWEKVKEILRSLFHGTGVTITVYHLPTK
eukprot:TRINITY_DN68072_c9_g1_i1.p1 TRINITY_DN68072_c9_g1~~TRINITY_DN68072_c9_g1_i1.p1  ORF type:complete len:151 (-),score=21.95 TRINITY_DN68072_c9_g1_i1:181-633(-)